MIKRESHTNDNYHFSLVRPQVNIKSERERGEEIGKIKISKLTFLSSNMKISVKFPKCFYK